MTHKKLAAYSFVLAILFLVLTFSIVKRNGKFRTEESPEALPESTPDVFFAALDTSLSDIQIQNIRPIFGGVQSNFDKEWGRNPFQPFPYQSSIRAKRPRQRFLRLEGILQKGRQRKAIINGKILTVGGQIRNYRVKLILENMVALQNGNREIYLKF